MSTADAALSDDAFLGGRLQLLQPTRGFRAGLDAVMLAAAVPAHEGAHVLEAGLGIGAASLCLMTRVAGIAATGVEIDAAAAALAADNAARNARAGLRVVVGDVERPGSLDRAALPANSFDHAFANPPYHLAGETRAPADAGRARAHQRDDGGLECWARFLVGSLKAGGTMTLILPATAMSDALQVLAGRVGGIAIFPLFPRSHEPASRVIVQGRKGSRAALRLLPGLVLHAVGHAFTAEAEAVLRHAAALRL